MTFRYVRLADVETYLALGWLVVMHEPDHHSVHSVYMRWICPCEPKEPPVTVEEIDDVNRPAHYRQGKYETIDVIEDIVQHYKDDPVTAGLIWQVLKYVCRAPHKGAMAQDLMKAEHYLRRAINRECK